MATRNYSILITIFKGHLYGITLSRRREKKTFLSNEEKGKIVTYLLEMQSRGFPLHIGKFRAKVHEFTQARVMPFKDGIPS